MKHEFLKFVVQLVVIQRDDDGNVVGEGVTDPTAVYSREQLIEVADQMVQQLAAQQEAGNNGGATERPARSKK